MAKAAMTEKDWQLRIVGALKLFGWRHAHFRPLHTAKGWRTPVSGDAGFPDLVLVRPPRVIFAELKVGAPVSPQQADWLSDLGRVPGVESYIWRPTDWDQVVELLK
jgi:hypothetical protein